MADSKETERKLIYLRHPKEKLNNVEVRADDVYSMTYVRSGTHWIKHIIRLILNDGNPQEPMPENIRGGFLEFILAKEDDDPSALLLKDAGHPDVCVDIKTLASPRYLITHMTGDFLPRQLNEKKPKIIYLARNPKDVLVSVYYVNRRLFKEHTPETDRQLWKQVFDGFLNGNFSVEHGYWHKHVLTWWNRRHEENVLFLKYEDMRKDTVASIQKIAQYLGKDHPIQLTEKIAVLTSFATMKANPPDDHMYLCKALYTDLEPGECPMIRKGKVGGWKDHFTVAENELFDQHYEEWLKGTGLEFE